MLLFPLPFARNKENENIESRILIGCALYTKNRFKLCRLQGKDAVDKAYSEALSEMKLQESRIVWSKISTLCLTVRIPFGIINAEF